MPVTVKQLVESWERYIHAPRLLRAEAYEAFDQQMIAAGEQLAQNDACRQARVWEMRDAQRLLNELRERRPTCGECVKWVAGKPPAKQPTFDGWVSRDILGDVMTFHCRKCSEPEHPWARRISADELLVWMRANPATSVFDYDVQKIRRDLLGDE